MLSLNLQKECYISTTWEHCQQLWQCPGALILAIGQSLVKTGMFQVLFLVKTTLLGSYSYNVHVDWFHIPCYFMKGVGGWAILIVIHYIPCQKLDKMNARTRHVAIVR